MSHPQSLTHSARRKHLITAYKLNFNHLILLRRCIGTLKTSIESVCALSLAHTLSLSLSHHIVSCHQLPSFKLSVIILVYYTFYKRGWGFYQRQESRFLFLAANALITAQTQVHTLPNRDYYSETHLSFRESAG